MSDDEPIDPTSDHYLDFSLIPTDANDKIYLGLVIGNLPVSLVEGESLVIPLGEVAEVTRDFFIKLTFATQSAKAIKEDMDSYPDLTASEAIERYQIRITSSFN